MRQQLTRGDRGATSLFIVLFSTLLFSVITVGFISLMISDQRRAADSEWSEGAYDSALAGVEDGKRVLALCRDGNSESPACRAIADVDNVPCNTIAEAGLVELVDDEVLLQSVDGGGVAGGSVNQAYTCVIIKRETPDYKGRLASDDSVLIPLETGGKAFDKLVISWFSAEDSKLNVTYGSLGDTSLPVLDPLSSNWSATRPPIMRTQFMQYVSGEDITLENFDRDGYAHTTFLYPTNGVGLPTTTLAGDDIRNPGDPDSPTNKQSPKAVSCEKIITSVGYACSITVKIPDLPGAVSLDRRAALLRLTPLYNGARYRVQMKNSANEIVNFVDTQPSIDSTGRAGDVFRRVDARVDMLGSSEALYPRATIDVTGSLCKNFMIGISNTPWTCNPQPTP